MKDLIKRWPGKSAPVGGNIEHPAVYHMLDVAAVAERLIAPFGFARPLEQALAFLTALHDLGKIGAPFRAMLRTGVEVDLALSVAHALPRDEVAWRTKTFDLAAVL